MSSRRFKELDLAHAVFPQLRLQVDALKIQVEHLRYSNKMRTRTSTLNAARATLWEKRHDEVFVDRERLRRDLMERTDPFWIRALIFTLGALAAVGIGLAI